MSAPDLWPAFFLNLSKLKQGTRDIAAFLAGKAEGIMTADDFYALLNSVDRDAAFTISRLASVEMIEQAWEALTIEAATGGTLADFWKTLDEFYDTHGWTTELGPAHVENIFRTNMSKAMNAGRHEYQLDHVEDAPFWMYDAYDEIYDPKTGTGTCPLCSMLDGRIYRWDSAFWSTYYPPLHFQCRCKVLHLSADQIDGIRGARLYTEMPPTVDGLGKILLPSKGFGAPPASTLTNDELIEKMLRAIARMERKAG